MRISDWSSDVCSSDLSLYVTAQDTLEHPVFRVDAATGKVERLKASPEAFEGNIGDVTPLPGGALLYSRNSALTPTDLFVRDAKGEVGQLTDVNAATLAEFDPVTLEKIQFAGATGDKVWGMILKPQKATRRWPVASLVPGGPQGAFGTTWWTR